MKRLITAGLMSLALVIAYSSVYACDHTATATPKAPASHEVTTTGKTIRSVVVGATRRCATAESVVAFDIDVPGRTSPRYIHIETTTSEPKSSPSVIRTAMTLGRALITTVEAVMGELIDAATEKTASIV